jgi:hypothetical protein
MVLLPSRKDECDAITVYEIVDQSLREVVSLELFPCADGVKLVPHLSANPPLNQKPSAPGLLWLPDTHVVKVQCWMMSVDVPEEPVCDSYDCFVPMSVIQQHASSGDRGSALRIKWTEWGPNNSEGIMTKNVELDYFVYGNRFVSRDEHSVAVFDFSPNVTVPSKEPRKIPDGWFPGQYRADPVLTYMPYHKIQRDVKSKHLGYKYDQSAMIDHEHVLLINVGSVFLVYVLSPLMDLSI